MTRNKPADDLRELAAEYQRQQRVKLAAKLHEEVSQWPKEKRYQAYMQSPDLIETPPPEKTMRKQSVTLEPTQYTHSEVDVPLLYLTLAGPANLISVRGVFSSGVRLSLVVKSGVTGHKTTTSVLLAPCPVRMEAYREIKVNLSQGDTVELVWRNNPSDGAPASCYNLEMTALDEIETSGPRVTPTEPLSWDGWPLGSPDTSST